MTTEPLHQNIWSQGNHIYYTVVSGIDVYSSIGVYEGFVATPSGLVFTGIEPHLDYFQDFSSSTSANDWNEISGPGDIYDFTTGYMRNNNNSTTTSEAVTYQTFSADHNYFDIKVRLIQGSSTGAKTDTTMYFFTDRTASPTTPYFHIHMSAYGSNPIYDYWAFRIYDVTDTLQYELRLNKWDYSANLGTWFWGRVVRDGDDFYFKHWKYGDSEPSGWDGTQTLSGLDVFSGPIYARSRTSNYTGYDDITLITTTPLYDISYTSSVWANDDHLYVGTTLQGIYRTEISGVLTNDFASYKQYPQLTSNKTNYIHGTGNYLCITTQSGVDRYDLRDNSRVYTSVSAASKCYQTSSGTLYYTENNLLAAGSDDASLGNPLRNWTYYNHITFPATSIDNAQVRVRFKFDFPYHHFADGAGSDLRFLDPDGNNLSYYIENWHPDAVILVKVVHAGTNNFYMIYGNSFATAQSNIKDAYYFYDGFEGTSLDTSIWQANTRGDGTVSVQDGYVRLRDNDNDGTDIITKVKIPYSMLIEANVRRASGGTTSQFDGYYGYTGVDFSSVNPKHGVVNIDIVTGPDDTAHRLNANDSGSRITGTKYISTSFKPWTGVWAYGFQRSTYDGETLTLNRNDPIFLDSNYFFFHINNASSNPDLHIEWVRMSTWPEINTYTTQEYLLQDLIYPKLHAVYTPSGTWFTSDYVYSDFYSNPLFFNDIHITEGTSSYNDNNTIFLATDYGAYVIEERRGDEINSFRKQYFIS